MQQSNKKDKKIYGHPTVKPLNIIENIITNSSLENDVILDPFAGSGTTGVACSKLNRNYILFEKESKWCDVAKKRLENQKNQLSIFDL